MAIYGTGDSGFDQVSWDLFTRFALRPELFYDRIASVQATNLDKRGSTVRFTKTADLAAATTPLSEKVDVDGVTFSDSNVDVVLDEYGNAVVTTARIRGTSYLDVDPVVANLLGYNAGLSIDTITRDVLHGGDNVHYSDATATQANSQATDVLAADILQSRDIRKVVANLRTANVPGISESAGLYTAFIHPHVSVDLRQETGTAAWRDPHVYGISQMNIWRGDIGIYEDVRFVETPRALLTEDGGDGGTVDLYSTLVVGWEALAKAYSSTVSDSLPQVMPGPVTDKLMRFRPMGWYWFGGYKIFRQESLWRIDSASSLGDNS